MSKYEAEQFLHGFDLGESHIARLAVYKWLKANVDRNDTVLDVPSGSGVDVKGISDVCRYVGMDRTDIVLEAAEFNNPDVKFIKGDILNNPSKDGEFEWVHARAIFEHLANLEDVETAMRECYRVASKGCIFAFFLPPGDNEGIDWNGEFFNNRYKKADIEAILHRLGGEISYEYVDVSGTNFVDHYAIWYVKKPQIEVKEQKAPRVAKKKAK